MSRPPEILSRPLALPSGLTLRNRIGKSAMSEGLGDLSTGDPRPELARLYARWAAGGPGLLVTGNVMVTPDGVGEPGNVLVREDSPLGPYEAWAKAGNSDQSACFVQLNHAGRQVPRLLNPAPVAPSAVPVRVGVPGVFAPPRALELEEIGRIVAAFGRAAALVKRAGFAGVQLHGAHGYLISQFLSPLSNRREDRYGGPLDNRMRFLMECYRAVRASVGESFAVALKLNSADFLRGGFAPEEAVVVARTISEEGLDLLEISGGTYEKPSMMKAPPASTSEREAHFLSYAREIRKAVSCPLMLTGGLRTPEVMARIIEDGSVDLAGIARPLAVEPDFPREALAGRLEPALTPRHPAWLKTLSASVELSWHQRQIHRLARGLEPERKVGWLAPMLGTARDFVLKSGKYRAGALKRGL